MNILYSASLRLVSLGLLMTLAAPLSSVWAFEPDTYAENSRLAQGKWVKISVPESGLYKITTADLRRYGFTDPGAVRVMGYGGRRISDVLSLANYRDDLFAAPQEATASGIVFYGVGPESWTPSTLPGSITFAIHSLNPFSTAGYYFLTDGATDLDTTLPTEGTPGAPDNAATTYLCSTFHETDIFSLGETGHLLLGEDFRYERSRSFSFDTPDAASESLRLQIRFGVTSTSASSLTIAVNGTEIENKTAAITPSTASSYGAITTIRRTLTQTLGDRTTVGLTYSPVGTVKNAALDCIDLSYDRHIRLRQGSLCFSLNNPAIALDGADQNTRVWDVTDLAAPLKMNVAVEGSQARWTNSFGGARQYAAWNDAAQLPSPELVGTVANQDIHGAETPDMVIFTPEEWRAQAQRVADMHSTGADSLRVLVVTDHEVFNEFSSGTPDVGALRRMLKMMYDRGADSTGHSLRYALLFGRATHDNRCLTQAMQALRQRYLVGWSTDDGVRESDSYCTDDILAMLEDGSGQRMINDKICIGVGRLPLGTSAEAKAYTDKLIAYVNSSKPGTWKNRIMFVADDGDNGDHLRQSEAMDSLIRRDASGRAMHIDKVYVDAYDEVGGISEIGRELMHNNLQEGTIWWNYIGHANKQGLTSERLLTYNDFSTVRWRQLPFFNGATCSFMRWDGVDKSGSEIMLHNSGGIIGGMAAVREVYISENEKYSNAVARCAFVRDERGRYPALGDIYRQAKNNVVDKNGNLSSSSNKLRYALMGDPAMRLAIPASTLRVDSICGIEVTADSQPTLMARQRVRITGAVLNPADLSVIDDFNGSLSAVLYDAERSITSKGRPSDNTDGRRITFEQQGSMLFNGCGNVSNGHFTLDISMPEEISDNFRPAALNLHAAATDGREAITCFRNLYVYGYDENAEPDSIPPVIEYAYLNHSTFTDGDKVNSSPMFIACVTDNVGINLSSAGVGHRLTVKIDGRESFADVASYYSPLTDGSIGGTIAYPLEDLKQGYHELSFRAWDTSGNSTTHTLSFNVTDRLSPEIFEVYTDANPASTHANFYVSHNRPDAEMTVTIEVFSLSGRLEWSAVQTDRSDMFTSAPITWNLCNSAGHRVARGIYLYRATISCDGQESQSLTRRLAVTAQ